MLGGIMTEAEFMQNMRRADVGRFYSTPLDHSFWSGYTRGLRRYYHGEKFGTMEEHQAWLGLAEEPRDQLRQLQGIGYHAGFEGTSGADAAQLLRKVSSENE
jgi:hypothetical protein